MASQASDKEKTTLDKTNKQTKNKHKKTLQSKYFLQGSIYPSSTEKSKNG